MRKAGWLGGGLVAGILLTRYLFSYSELPSFPEPKPAKNHQEAMQRLKGVEERDGVDLLPVCHTRVWQQQDLASSCVVLLHGYTNCPHQFEQLGDQLYADGHTVVAARLPYHGQPNRMPENLSEMTVSRLGAAVAEVIDAAQGLGGQKVTLLGHSLGGLLTGWAAQYRPDIDHAVLVSPPVALLGFKRWQHAPIARMLPNLRDKMLWWDQERKMDKLGPKHGYVGFSTRGVGRMVQIGGALIQKAKSSAPKAKRITVVINPSDSVVDVGKVRQLAERWQRKGANVEVFEFPAELELIHDLIDPQQPGQQVAQVYPVLRELVISSD